jgi:hypothetical protein
MRPLKPTTCRLINTIASLIIAGLTLLILILLIIELSKSVPQSTIMGQIKLINWNFAKKMLPFFYIVEALLLLSSGLIVFSSKHPSIKNFSHLFFVLSKIGIIVYAIIALPWQLVTVLSTLSFTFPTLIKYIRQYVTNLIQK